MMEMGKEMFGRENEKNWKSSRNEEAGGSLFQLSDSCHDMMS